MYSLSTINKEVYKERLCSKIKVSNGCWNFTGYLNPDGYGMMRVKDSQNSFMVTTHRLSFYLHHSDPNEMYVCHTCDNPSCVNPEHLFLGDQYDNMQDMVRKDRHSKEGNSENEAYYQSILNYYKNGGRESHVSIAKKLNIKPAGIFTALTGKTLNSRYKFDLGWDFRQQTKQHFFNGVSIIHKGKLRVKIRDYYEVGFESFLLAAERFNTLCKEFNFKPDIINCTSDKYLAFIKTCHNREYELEGGS